MDGIYAVNLGAKIEPNKNQCCFLNLGINYIVTLIFITDILCMGDD